MVAAKKKNRKPFPRKPCEACGTEYTPYKAASRFCSKECVWSKNGSKPQLKPAPQHDLTGQIFGRLTVIKLHRSVPGSGFSWDCRCECGKEAVVKTALLRNGGVRSCGCLMRDTARERHLQHGHNRSDARTGEYGSWAGAKTRCTNPNHPAFHNYGGRGISMCDRWLNSFELFLQDMGPKPTPQHSIDRINNDGNYEPGNCRWATSVEQGRNNRRTRMVELNGETRCIIEWCEILGTPQHRVRSRLKRGWTEIDALTKVVGPNGPKRKAVTKC